MNLEGVQTKRLLVKASPARKVDGVVNTRSKCVCVCVLVALGNANLDGVVLKRPRERKNVRLERARGVALKWTLVSWSDWL